MVARKLTWTILGIIFASFNVSTAEAQNWADQLFEKRSHDFGYVARNAKCEFGFVVKNVLNRRVHIASVTPSCPVCTVSKPEKEWLEPGESTVIKASINTRNIIGSKDVSITVFFDQPSYATTRLQLKCYSRSDVVLSENEIGLGVVKRGQPASKTIEIRYAGRNDWTIDGATSTNPYVDTELEEIQRGGGFVGYRLTTTVRPDAPPGTIRDRIILGVKDAYNRSGIEVALNANIQADVSLSTAAIDFGNVAPGSTATKQVMVRGVRRFEILEIEGNDGPFHIEKPDDAKQLHILTVTLKAGDQAGDLSQEFQIKTDMDGEEPLKLNASAKLIGKPTTAQTAN